MSVREGEAATLSRPRRPGQNSRMQEGRPGGFVRRVAVQLMAERRAARGWTFWFAALTVAILASAVVLLVLNRATLKAGAFLVYALIGTIVLAYTGTGALLATRRPENPIGWIFCIVALALSVTAFGEQYALRGLVTSPGSLPGVRYVQWAGDWSFNLSIAPLLFVFLLFPNGRVLSRRWRPVAWLGLAVLVVGVAGWALHPHAMSGVTNAL